MSTEKQLRRTPITNEQGIWITILIPTIAALLAAFIMIRLDASGVAVPDETSLNIASSAPRTATMSALPAQSITSEWVDVTTFGDCHLQADVTNPTEVALDIQIQSDAGTLSYTVPKLSTRRFWLDYFTTSLAILSGPERAAISAVGPTDISCLADPARLATVRTPAVARSLTRTKLLPS